MNVNPRVTAALEPSLGDGTSNRRNTTCTRRDSNPRLGVEWTIYIPPVHPRRVRRRRRRLHAAGKQSHRFPEADPGGKLRTTKTTEATKREGKRRTKAETKLRQQGKKEEREEDHEKRTGGNRKTKRERNGTREKTEHLETKGRKEKQEEKKKGALGSKTQEQRSPTILELAKSDRTRNSA